MITIKDKQGKTTPRSGLMIIPVWSSGGNWHHCPHCGGEWEGVKQCMSCFPLFMWWQKLIGGGK